jgi:CRISPR-associated protein Cas2
LLRKLGVRVVDHSIRSTRLEAIIDRGQDSLRYYYLGADWRRRVEHVGAKPAVDLNGPLIV